MTKRLMPTAVMLIFLFMTAAGAVAQEVQGPAEGGHPVAAASDGEHAPPAAPEEAAEEGEDGHEKGMHGLMPGGHSGAWSVVIGVIMIVMMAAMML